MAQNKFEQAKAQLESALGEPVLQSAGVSAAGQSLLMRTDGDSPFWRPYLTVNGQPQTRVPRTMFLILTPTRLVITGLRKYAPDLDAPILTLQRGDAEITATQNSRRVWTYCLRSRASGAELEVEMEPYGGFGATLAEQLREFSVTPTTPMTPTTPTTLSTADATEELGYNRRSALRKYRRGTVIGAICGLLISLALFGVGARQYYAYQTGTPTKATIVSCSTDKYNDRTCQGTWSISGTFRTWADQWEDRRQPTGRFIGRCPRV